MEYFILSLTGQKIPAIGYGSGTKWQIKKKGRSEDLLGTMDEALAESVEMALNTGFRHLDTAEIYTTALEIGEGVHRFLDNTNTPRKDIFITDKYNPGFGPQRPTSSGPFEALTKNLKIMKLEYVDLYLLHSPWVSVENSGITLKEAWQQMESLKEKGLAKNIGVSNFAEEHLKELFSYCKIAPQVNQIEFNPYLPNQTPGIVEFCKAHDILVEAFSPLSPLFRGAPGPLDSVLDDLSKKYNKSATQLLLRWVYQHGVLPLTTSSQEQRCRDALAIFSFKLDQSDLELISQVGKEKVFRAFFTDIYGKYDK